MPTDAGIGQGRLEVACQMHAHHHILCLVNTLQSHLLIMGHTGACYVPPALFRFTRAR
ncbi:hypothetical protein [Geopseudomonas sagittaria]|nr:hypothetical protein [Pseudomonas sagittaria]